MTTQLETLIGSFRGRRIAVLADLVADEFVYADIERVSREAPVLVLEHRRSQLVLGGGGNAVANLRALGADPRPVGVVGRDETGRRLLAELKRRGISTAGIRTAAGYRTPTKSRILAGGVHTRRQQIVRVDRGSRHGELAAAAQAGLIRRLASTAAGCDGLLVADYGYGAATPALLASVPRRRLPAIVTVDSRSRTAEFRRVTTCTPNQEELERAAGRPLADDSAIERAARNLLRRMGADAVLVTRGSQGMELYEKGRPRLAIPAFGSDEVADVTGAGDTVIATHTLALAAGADVADASRLANVAAGLVVMKAGTATVSERELRRALREARA